MSKHEEWLRIVTSPRAPRSERPRNLARMIWPTGLGDCCAKFNIDASLPRTAVPFAALQDTMRPRDIDRDVSLYVWVVEGLDVAVWFKDTQPGKPATAHIEGHGLSYTVRLHIRPTTVVHAKLQCEGGADELNIRLPADFSGRLVVNTYNSGSAHIRMADAFRLRARILSSKSLGCERGYMPERFAYTLFIGDGYDENTEWTSTSIEVVGYSHTKVRTPETKRTFSP